MDWTFPYTGLDLSYVWDPEMWIKFREAVKWNTPEVFWNKLWDRISYSKCGILSKRYHVYERSKKCQIEELVFQATGHLWLEVQQVP